MIIHVALVYLLDIEMNSDDNRSARRQADWMMLVRTMFLRDQSDGICSYEDDKDEWYVYSIEELAEMRYEECESCRSMFQMVV